MLAQIFERNQQQKMAKIIISYIFTFYFHADTFLCDLPSFLEIRLSTIFIFYLN